MAESISVKARLSALDNGFTSTLKNALGATEKLQSRMKSGFSFGVFAGMGQKAFSMVSGAVSGLVGEINSSNMAWKTFEGNMAIMGKTGKEVEGVKKELQEFAEQTIYSSSDMAQTYAQLEAVGTKNTAALVKGFGGLAAAAENPQQAMKTLSTQATQMAARPTVAWADFKLMLEQSPAGMAAVAKGMGMTTSELVSKIQDGEVATTDFLNAIAEVGTSDSFASMATQAKSMGQSMDSLKETLGNKLTPAFEVLNQVGINALDGLGKAIGKIDAKDLADKLQKAVDVVKEFIGVVKGSFKGVGKAFGDAFKAIGSALGKTMGGFNKTSALEKFKSICTSVANALKKFAGFLEKNADTIAKVMPWVVKLGGAFLAFKVVKSVAPGLTSFAGSLLKMAGKGVAGLAARLLGISKAQDAVGKSSGGSSKKMLASAKAFMMLGAGALMIAGAVALLAQSAIALANAGWPAIAVMAGLVIVVAGLAVGLVKLMQSMKAGPKKLTAMSTAMLAMGAALLMAGAGMALLAFAAISLAAAGWPAIAVMIGLVGVIALLAIGASLLGASLTAGAIGFIAFGAAIALCGVGALLAAVALNLIVGILPALIEYGASAALSIIALGAGLVVFAVGAGLAGAACIVLGAGLLIIGAALLVAGAAMLLFGTGALLAAGALAIISLVLPLIANYGQQGAIALLALGGALVVFSLGAAVAGAACVVLGAGILLMGAGILLAGAGMLMLGAATLLATAALAIMAVILPTLATYGMQGAAALLALGGALTLFAVGATLAGIAALVLALGLLTVTLSVVAFGAAMIVASAGTLLLAVALLAVTAEMKSIAKSAKSAEKSLKAMRKSVSVVESGLKAIKGIAKSAMEKLLSAFDNTAPKMQASGMKVALNFVTGVQMALLAGVPVAFAAGANIALGFANGMASQLARIKEVAAQMAAAADKAVRAKAKIHSPSKVSEKLGGYWGEGFTNGISDMTKEAWRAATDLVSMPTVNAPRMGLAFAGEMSEDYSYYRSAEYSIEVPVVLDGKEVARVTAPYTEAELNKRNARESRKRGRI